MNNYKIIRFYHKPYKIFKDDFIINIGMSNLIFKNDSILKWLSKNMDNVYDTVDYDPRYSEFPAWREFLNDLNNDIDNEDFISLQAYSKCLDLRNIYNKPLKQTCEYEFQTGKEFSKSDNLSSFGYYKENFNKIFRSYDGIFGNFYPCHTFLSWKKLFKPDPIQILIMINNFIDEENSQIYTNSRLRQYIEIGRQYWSGQFFLKTKIIKRIIEFSFTIMNKMNIEQNGEKIFNDFYNPLNRHYGFMTEWLIGYCLFCESIECKRPGFVQTLVDKNITFSENIYK